MDEKARPAIRFTKTRDGVRIAYSIQGDGPPLVFVRALNSHAELWWSEPSIGSYFLALARHFTVVLFDSRGNGLSDPSEGIDLDHLCDDLDAVVRDLDLSDVTVYGQGFGSPVAMAYAAREPSLVKRLLLYCAYARGTEAIITSRFIETMRTLPAAAIALMARETSPDAEELPSRSMGRRSFFLTPEIGAAYFEFARRLDVEGLLGQVRAPTLVMQPRRSPVIPEGAGRLVAERIPNARFITVPGGAYNPWTEITFEPTLRAIGDFVGVELADTGYSRPVVLLLTDMVDSTAITQRVGEARSRELHELHERVVREAVGRNDGEVVQHMGDGIMASFGSVGAALSCALAIQRYQAEGNRDEHDPVEVRIGLATGEAYLRTGIPFTSAAQLVTRVTGRASPGQVLVTQAVCDLASSDQFDFGPARSLLLKGFPDRVRLHELVGPGG